MKSRTAFLVGAAFLLVAGGALGVMRVRGGDGAPAIPSEVAKLYQETPARRGTTTDSAIETYQSYLTKKPDDPILLARLGAAYLQKARETADPTWYTKADQVLSRSLNLAPENGDALNGMGVLALARHQFAEALDWGQRAVKDNPARAANYGIVGDALVELGRYDEAAATVQKMVDTRPDLSSYSRVSYLRELHGDVDGALAAMRQAVAAGGPATENTSYVRVQLGNLLLGSGRLDEAEQQYRITLERSPSYGPAQAGLAYVQAARGNDAEAIGLLTKAVEAYPLPEYIIALGDLYTRTGRTEDAGRQYDLVRAIERLFAANGTDVDTETALFEADHGVDPAGAVARAREGYARRPSIHAADALAWSLYRAGRSQEAERYAAEALRLGTRDALKLYHAGMIARALGRADQARACLAEALTINPHFSILLAAEARETLAGLGGSVPAQGAARTQP